MTTAYSEMIRRMPLQEKVKLGFEIVGAYTLARWRLRRHDLPTAVAAMRTRYAERPRVFDDPLAEKYAAVRLGKAIGRTLGVLPLDSRCLVRSLVLAEMLARRGIEVQMPVRRSRVDALDLISYTGEEARLDLRVSSGTYVRAIADALGGHCRTLRRLEIGPFSVDEADPGRFIPPDEALARL